MILLISDIHGFFSVINDQITHAEKHAGKTVEKVVVLGDFGLFKEKLHRFFIRQKRNFLRPVYFIDGNHEEFTRFSELLETYKEHLTHFPRGSLQNLAGHDCLCLGGSSFIDVLNTPEAAEIKDKDIDQCLINNKNAAEIVLTHDCPRGIGVPDSSGWDIHGPTGFRRSQELINHFSPKLWFFGHHHRWFDKTIHNTRFLGLPLGWQGYILLDHYFTIKTVQNTVIPEQSILKRWFGGLLGG